MSQNRSLGAISTLKEGTHVLLEDGQLLSNAGVLLEKGPMAWAGAL